MMETIFTTMKDGAVDNLVVVNPSDQKTIDALGCVQVPDGVAVTIGWSFANGVFTPPPKTLEQAQSEQLVIIEAAYQSANTTPIAFAETTFQADADSVALMAQVATALPIGASITWYDSTNVGHLMDDMAFTQLRQAILLRGQPLFAKKQGLKASIRLATTVAEVEAVTW